jgi:2'-5' RNA ligase superfamily protein
VPPDWATTIIAPVPAAEPVVADLRAPHDPSAAFAVPAHLTLLGPFLPVASLDVAIVERLGALLASEAAIEVTFREARRFPDAVYLAPEPAAPFLRLTQRLWDAWPECPPYGGAHDVVIPHLTIGHPPAETELSRIEAQLAGRLPIAAVVDHAALLAYDREALEAIWAGRPAAPSPARALARIPFGSAS